MSREEAAAIAVAQIETGDDGVTVAEDIDRTFARTVLAAADAHDAAHGIHRISLDDATVERAAEVLLAGRHVCECKRSPFDKHDVNPPCSTRTWARQTARAVLAAAVKAGQ